jgi:DNA-binding FadR family transcriptional regulator
MTSLGIGPEARRRLSARRTAEIVADELRRQIIDGVLVDGDLLPRQEVLVEQFNVSLVSLREALRILETEGLVSVRRGNRGGAVVHAPAKASAAYMLGLLLQSDYVPLADLGTALQEFEPMCAALAARRPDRNDALVPKLKEINDSMAEHIEDGARFTEIGGQFHDELVRGCGNHTMIAVVGSLETLWTGHLNWWAEETAARGEYPSMNKRRIALSTHTKVTDAIETGDADRARKLAARHIADTKTFFIAGDPEQRIVALSPQALARRQR